MKKILKLLESKDLSSVIPISLFLFLVFYFVLYSFRFTPQDINELDSLGQHIPLAESILNGRMFNPTQLHSGLGYYLPVGEIILASFMWMGIPLGLYNVLALIILFYLCFKLGLRAGIDDKLSIVFAFSISYLNSIIRLIPTQKNDIWLNIFFIWIFYLLLKPKINYKYFIILGISTGLLIGVKYSGILFAIILYSFYFKDIRKYINTIGILSFSVPVFLLGLIWFLRNYLLVGNPFYPVSIFGFNGHPDFIVPRGFENIINLGSLKLTIEAFLSEYLLWSSLPLLLLYTYFKKGKGYFSGGGKLIILGIVTAFIYLMSPTDFTRVNITSNMRFLHIPMIVLILATFIMAKKIKKDRDLIILSILSSVAVLTQLSYYPKLIIIWLVAMFSFLTIKKILLRT